MRDKDTKLLQEAYDKSKEMKMKIFLRKFEEYIMGTDDEDFDYIRLIKNYEKLSNLFSNNIPELYSKTLDMIKRLGAQDLLKRL